MLTSSFARIFPRRNPAPVCIVTLFLLALALACGTSEAPDETGSSPDGRGTPVAASQNDNTSQDPAPGGASSSASPSTGTASQADAQPTGAASGDPSSTTAPSASTSGTDAGTGPAGQEQGSNMPAAVPIPTRTIPVEEVTWSIQGVFPLHQAAFDGKLAEVAALLDQGESVGARTQIVSSSGETREVTPIELAVWNNTPQVVEVLIENGGAEPLRSEAHSTLALIAVQHNPDPGVMEALLKAFEDQFQNELDEAEATVQRGYFQFKSWAAFAAAMELPCEVLATARYPEPVDRFLALGWEDYLSGESVIFGNCENTPNENTPGGFLGKAVVNNPHPEVLQVFLDHGADVNRIDNGLSYLHLAAQHNPEPAVAAALMDQGLDVNLSDGNGQTPLQLAIQHNDEPSMAAILIARGADVNVDIEGWSHSWHPLWLAMGRNPVDAGLIRLLLEAGADPNVKVADAILLHRVMRWDEPDLSEVVALLLEKGAKVNARDSIRRTALHYAVEPNSLRRTGPGVVKLLLEAGADVNAQDQRGTTPLHMAWFNVEVVQLLLEGGGDVNLPDPERGSLLHLAARLEEAEVLVGLLLDAGADPNGKDPNGDTALHLSVSKPGAVERLLDGGADVDARDSNGLTALYLAIGRGGGTRYPGYPETVEVLLDRGADPHADLGGRTPCQRAQQHEPYSPGGQRLLELACSP